MERNGRRKLKMPVDPQQPEGMIPSYRVNSTLPDV